MDRCDLGDLDDVRRFAADLAADLGERHLDVLVHNAGAMPPERTESPQGHELAMAVHLLGPVLMTELLRPRLRDARVVLVTSGGMYGQRLRADDPEFHDGEYSPTTSYARSKRAQVELCRCCSSGGVPTGSRCTPRTPAGRTPPASSTRCRPSTGSPARCCATRPAARTPRSGSAATEPEPAGGRLWHDRRPRPPHLLRRTRTGPAERDALWAWVEAQLGLEGP